MINLDITINSKAYDAGQSGVLSNVLSTIDIQVEAGQFVAIVGPSGAGKSTLLNMVAGLEASEPGGIKYNGIPLADQPPCKVGYIFQQPRLMPWLTLVENLRLVVPEATDSAIDALLEEVGLDGKGALHPRQLSGGMQRRVGIARAFANTPELLLLDEPFISLDAPNARRLRALLENLWFQSKATVIFVTHDLSEAIQLADRIIFLSSSPGTVIQDINIDLPRPRREGGSEELLLETSLLRYNPGLLEGEPEDYTFKAIAGGRV
ncbi:MAG: ABC transporter ATP-binding protein [Motiliproteus sp.]